MSKPTNSAGFSTSTARRQVATRNGKTVVVILPPEKHGDAWVGAPDKYMVSETY